MSEKFACPHCGGDTAPVSTPSQELKRQCRSCGKTFILGTGPTNAVNLREGVSEVKEL
jgi:ribosomal protein S27E